MHDTKLAAALAYLRERNLYILDRDNQFIYIPPDQTDVRTRIADEIVVAQWALRHRAVMDMRA